MARFTIDNRNPHLDLQQGLRYAWNGAETRLDWRTNFQAFAALPCINRAPHHPGKHWDAYHFQIPLFFGDLELPGAQINVPNDRFFPNVPIDHIYIEVRFGAEGPDNYWQVKNYLLRSLGQPDSCWERDDQLHALWDCDGVELSLTYWFKSRYNPQESGAVALSFSNNRVFPEYFEDEYVREMQWNEPQLIAQVFDIPFCGLPYPMSYRYFPWMRFTPASVVKTLEGKTGALAVWLDTTNKKLGIALPDNRFCVIADFNASSRFILQWVDMDRGAEQDELQLVNHAGKPEMLVCAAVGALDPVAAMLEHAGLRVERNPRSDARPLNAP